MTNIDRIDNFENRLDSAYSEVLDTEKQAEPKIITGLVKHDPVEKPAHYQGRNGIEALEVIGNFLTPEEERGFYKGNALKYLLREKNKNGLEDLKKARKNLDYLIAFEENQ